MLKQATHDGQQELAKNCQPYPEFRVGLISMGSLPNHRCDLWQEPCCPNNYELPVGWNSRRLDVRFD